MAKDQYDELDFDDLLDQLSPDELQLLASEVDPDVSRGGWVVRGSGWQLSPDELQLLAGPGRK